MRKMLCAAVVTATLLPGCGVQKLLQPQPTLTLGAEAMNLQPGEARTVPVRVADAGPGAVEYSVESSDVRFLGAQVDTTGTITLTVPAAAPPQGLIPVTVKAKVGDKTLTHRLGVQIGGKTDQLLARFNAVRAIAGLNPVTLHAASSMDCWLHGRYRAENDARFHTEDPALPYATPGGADCAGHSNLSTNYIPVAAAASDVRLVDILFTVPFHAVGMLNPAQQEVGIGLYTQPPVPNQPWLKQGGGIRSYGPQSSQAVTFPGPGQTTFLARYGGGEWPNPLTACPGFEASQAGLPLVVRSGTQGDTTVNSARLSVDGAEVEVCAFGSTQYVNTVDVPGSYPDGVKPAQDVARSILRGYGAVVIIPKVALQPGRTYQAQVVVNGQPTSWTFNTAAQLSPQLAPHAVTGRPAGELSRPLLPR